MSIYTHQGFCGRVPRDYQEGVFDRHEQQLAWEDKYYGSFGSDFGPNAENEEGVFLRDGGMGQIDLGGILAQPVRDLLGEGHG